MQYETEEAFQADCYTWAHNTYPEIRGLLCYNLNNSKNRRSGAINKGMGLQPGRSDFVLYWKGKAYMIEMKLPGKGQEPKQKEWERKILNHGFTYKIIDNYEEFKDYISEIIQNH